MINLTKTELNNNEQELVVIEKEINYLQSKAYDYLENVLSEQDVLGEFENYDGSTYICDAISEIADSYIPIYHSKIWKNVEEISEYIEEAISEGLVDTRDFDLTRAFQAGYYHYYSVLLQENLEALVFNEVVYEINKYIEEESLSLDISELDVEIENLLSDIDNNNTYSDIEEIIEELKKRLDYGEFEA